MELTQFPFKIIAKFHLGDVCEENHSCEFETSFPRKCVEIQKPLRAYEPSCKELTMTFKLPERIITSTRPPLSLPLPPTIIRKIGYEVVKPRYETNSPCSSPPQILSRL